MITNCYLFIGSPTSIELAIRGGHTHIFLLLVKQLIEDYKDNPKGLIELLTEIQYSHDVSIDDFDRDEDVEEDDDNFDRDEDEVEDDDDPSFNVIHAFHVIPLLYGQLQCFVALLAYFPAIHSVLRNFHDPSTYSGMTSGEWCMTVLKPLMGKSVQKTRKAHTNHNMEKVTEFIVNAVTEYAQYNTNASHHNVTGQKGIGSKNIARRNAQAFLDYFLL